MGTERKISVTVDAKVMERIEKTSEIDIERELDNILKTNRRYFWDKGLLNLRRDKYIIIERVLEFGTEEEVEIVLAYYGPESVKKVVKESRELSPKTVNYFSLLFGIHHTFL